MKRGCSTQENNSKSRAPQLARCIWTKEEDHKLATLVKNKATLDWGQIAQKISKMKRRNPLKQGKTAKQCRERWQGHLDPKIIKDQWSEEEENNFFKYHAELGNKWSQIASSLPGRTDNAAKNFFFCKLRKLARDLRTGFSSICLNESSLNNAEQKIYLLDHILKNYLPSEDQSNEPKTTGQLQKGSGDKYVMDIIEESKISYEFIQSYGKKLIESLDQSQQAKISTEYRSIFKYQNQETSPHQLGNHLIPLPPLQESLLKSSQNEESIKQFQVQQSIYEEGSTKAGLAVFTLADVLNLIEMERNHPEMLPTRTLPRPMLNSLKIDKLDTEQLFPLSEFFKPFFVAKPQMNIDFVKL